MSLPFFDALHRFFPVCQVDIVAPKSIRDVYAFHPAIRHIHTFDKAELKGPLGGFRYGRALQTQNRYDAFFTLTPSFSSAFLGYGVASRYRIGYKSDARSLLLTHSVTPEKGIHRAQSYYDLLHRFCRIVHRAPDANKEDIPRELPDFSKIRAQAMRFPFSAQEQRSDFLTKSPDTEYILCNVNSEAPSRRLPEEKWIVFGRRLLDDQTRKRRLVFSGGPSEVSRVNAVKEGIDRPDAILDYSGKTSLRELAMLLRDSDLVISNDSGPMHLANAVGAPLLCFMGAGDPAVTSPFNLDKTTLLYKSLECSPCVKNLCRFPTLKCLEQISVDELYNNSMTLLNKGIEGAD